MTKFLIAILALAITPLLSACRACQADIMGAATGAAAGTMKESASMATGTAAPRQATSGTTFTTGTRGSEVLSGTSRGVLPGESIRKETTQNEPLSREFQGRSGTSAATRGIVPTSQPSQTIAESTQTAVPEGDDYEEADDYSDNNNNNGGNDYDGCDYIKEGDDYSDETAGVGPVTEPSTETTQKRAVRGTNGTQKEWTPAEWQKVLRGESLIEEEGDDDNDRDI